VLGILPLLQGGGGLKNALGLVPVPVPGPVAVAAAAAIPVPVPVPVPVVERRAASAPARAHVSTACTSAAAAAVTSGFTTLVIATRGASPPCDGCSTEAAVTSGCSHVVAVQVEPFESTL
jgi:hypothetical protein